MTAFGSILPIRQNTPGATETGGQARPLRTGLTDLDQTFDTLMGRFFGNLPARWQGFEPMAALAPQMDIAETETGYTVTMELPGVEEKDINVAIEDGLLSVTGEKKSESESKGKTWHRVERRYGSFARSLRLPTDADEAKIEAKVKNGLLQLSIPRTAESRQKSRKIEIQSA